MRFFKKLALALFAVLAALPAFADRVTPQRAAEVASAFFADGAKRGVGMEAAGVSGDAYMAFNREGGGFVVVALNDAVTPILAYSYEGRFPAADQMPANMAWWFSQVAAQIDALPEDAKADSKTKSRWDNPAPVLTKSPGAAIQYETAQWGQDDPYNNHCPVLDDEHCLTGCVATAGSILARYFRWPDAGVGTVPGKTSGVPFPEHDLGYAYDWDNMPLEYYGTPYTDAQAEAVATLMYDMGTIAYMSYGLEASSSSAETLLTGLKQYMKYNKSAYTAKRADYSEEDWLALMRHNLENGPFIYSGAGAAGGHSFIIDGVDDSGRYHANWGWEGYCNCYCDVSNFHPEGQGYDFNNIQRMLVDLVPDYDGTSGYRDELTFSAYGDYAGLTTNVTEYARNQYFTCYVGYYGPSFCQFDGKIFISLYDKNGNFKQIIDLVNTDGKTVSIPMGSFKAFYVTCKISCEIQPGDRIKAYFVGANNDGFITAGPGCVDEIIVMEDTGGGDEPDPTAGYTAAETAASTALSYAKATSVLTLTFAHPANWAVKNSGGTTLASGTAADGGNVAINLSGYASDTYTISIGSTEDPFTFTITR